MPRLPSMNQHDARHDQIGLNGLRRHDEAEKDCKYSSPEEAQTASVSVWR